MHFTAEFEIQEFFPQFYPSQIPQPWSTIVYLKPCGTSDGSRQLVPCTKLKFLDVPFHYNKFSPYKTLEFLKTFTAATETFLSDGENRTTLGATFYTSKNTITIL
ncbi:hypothetical protein CEXT_194151 [Caerostris extrusa]|uniref:Uncharacterized protein n=1 Tax=Caerostris extrusa TaxID=172846 RepID=A0AAV4MM93_CAEEX|nr:hypothetical protein CEXT_194151 [Caerostris extrusa]